MGHCGRMWQRKELVGIAATLFDCTKPTDS